MRVYCVFSLESPHQGDSNECTQYTVFNINITLNYPKSAGMGFFFKGLKNDFETAVVNELSVFEPLKVYCISATYYHSELHMIPFHFAMWWCCSFSTFSLLTLLFMFSFTTLFTVVTITVIA